RAVLRGRQGRVWLGSLSRSALGWAASTPRTGHAGLQFSGAPALDARQLGGLFPPLGSGRRSPASIPRGSVGSSRMWCYGLSPPIKLLTSAPGGSNEVVLGNCLRHAINKLPSKLVAIASPVRKALRSRFHTLLYRARQRKGLRVFALGQRV